MFHFTLSFFLALFAATVSAASQIALFTDANCQDSYKGLDGPNGYPNGTCTDIRRSGSYGSLQVVGLDAGCAVTIYVDDPDTTVCGGLQKEIQLGECWNSTWAYYSIDMCDIGAINQPSSTPTSFSSKSSSPSPALLAACILGALAGVALLLGLALWLLRRKQRALANQQSTGLGAGLGMSAGVEVEARAMRGEMDASGQRHEMQAQAKTVYAHEVVEVGTPAVELAGLE
ncbi:hypothetical protein E8E13_005803 [Curvularia kusanoi]|uniref:Uncharacterized protein n=1 Tax=Curvularia kusanoi TaxID=90978 RepID=A0A9P4W3L7_CURKU|nr:hypothetical protein E8E13_005803 [Curvularia kusanoi]